MCVCVGGGVLVLSIRLFPPDISNNPKGHSIPITILPSGVQMRGGTEEFSLMT